MKILFTKASDDYWYEIVDCETFDDLYNNSDGYKIVFGKNENTNEKILNNCWYGMKKEDIPIVTKIKYEAIIYDDYLE